MADSRNPNDSLVLSYLELRKSVGVIGMSLPFVVALGKIVFESPGILVSISSYYYSIMGGVFVGSLFANGVFLWSYRGYDEKDSFFSRLAALFAIGIALFPTTPDNFATFTQVLIGKVHLFCAAGFFITLAYFALFLFTKTDPSTPMTHMKIIRNAVYRASGVTILLSIALIALVHVLPPGSPILNSMPVFWLESLATIAFGISWFVKGEAILKD